MNMQFYRKLPIPKEIKEQYPVTPEITAARDHWVNRIKAILDGRDDRLLLVIGPCSADAEDTVLRYIYRLREVQDRVSDRILIVPRIYTNKPRTTGDGYKGMLHQPDPESEPDLLRGLVSIRKLHMRAIAETGFGCADEMLYPENHRYLSDLLAYVAVGARSVEAAAPHDRKRVGYSRRHEESDWRRYHGDDELHHRRTAFAYVPLPRMGSAERGKSLRARDSARLCQ